MNAGDQCTKCGKGELQEVTGTVLLYCPICSSKIISQPQLSRTSTPSQISDAEIQARAEKEYPWNTQGKSDAFQVARKEAYIKGFKARDAMEQNQWKDDDMRAAFWEGVENPCQLTEGFKDWLQQRMNQPKK